MRSRGFTLLEILIAMAIFTLIGLASTGLLTTVIDSDEASGERFSQLQQLQRAMLIIERDMQQAIVRPMRLDSEQTTMVIRGGEADGSDADGIGFIRSGWHNPQMMLPRSTLQYVAYRLKEGTLERLHTNYVDNVIGTEPKIRAVLDDVEDFTVEFVASQEDVKSQNPEDLDWHDSYTGEVLPLGIRITIKSKAFGELQRVFSVRTGETQ